MTTAPLAVAALVAPTAGEGTVPPDVMTRFALLLHGASTRPADAVPEDRMLPGTAPVDPCESNLRIAPALEPWVVEDTLGLTLPLGVTTPRVAPWLWTAPDPYA